MYTIKEAAARTGVPIALLRAWERRYGVVAPTRTAGGYRVYDDAALERLRTMRRLVDDGWSPSVAAGAIVRGEIGTEAAVAAGSSVPESAAGDLVADFVSAAIGLDAVAVEGALDRIFAGGSFETVVDSTLLPALGAIGDAWAAGQLTVAGEHAASHAVLRRLAAAFQAAGRPAEPAGAILVGLPSGARHELAALAFSVAARRAGLPVLYLGPDLPTADWVATVRRTAAVAAVVGSPTRGDVAAAVDVGRAIRTAAPKTTVAFGGRHAETAAAELGGRRPALVLPNQMGPAVEALRSAVVPRSA
ncbi:MAG TPA: MerR family transcriptional regulator [Candidatus Limnocylindrales bacterium]|nr:MerR family transcriptional regulator [Candidatus Limnocylindrales bacterium]